MGNRTLSLTFRGGTLVIKYRLHNGLRVVMEQIPTFRSVTFGIWVKTGSRNESQTNNGISHFIEHMLFKGQNVIRRKISPKSLMASAGM